MTDPEPCSANDHPPAPADPATTVRNVCLVILAAVAVIAGLYLGSLFLIPIVFAMVLATMLRPVIRRMQKAHVPAFVGAILVVLGLIAGLVGLVMLLAVPVRAWLQDAPAKFDAAEARLARFREPVRSVTDMVAKAERAAEGPASQPTSQPTSQPAPAGDGTPTDGSTSTGAARAAPAAAPPAPAQPPGFAGKLFGTTTAIVGGVTEVLLLLLLILAGGGTYLRKLQVVLASQKARACAKEIAHEAEAVVLRYIVTTALISAGQAAVVGLALWWIGVPGPWLWAGLTLVLEFVPYLGAAVMMVLLSIVGLSTFDSTLRILAAPGSYLLITTIQNNLVSPIAYGNRLKLNPVAVLVGVLFWWSVWGIPGAFLAVPIVATIKVAADRIAWLKPVGVFLGE